MGILAKNELSNLDEKNSMECNAWGKKLTYLTIHPSYIYTLKYYCLMLVLGS